MTTSTDLGAALEAFVLEHEYCGELDLGVETDRVWMTCTCGAAICRTLEPAKVSLAAKLDAGHHI